MDEFRLQSGLLTQHHALGSRRRVNMHKVIGEKLHARGVTHLTDVEVRRREALEDRHALVVGVLVAADVDGGHHLCQHRRSPADGGVEKAHSGRLHSAVGGNFLLHRQGTALDQDHPCPGLFEYMIDNVIQRPHIRQ